MSLPQTIDLDAFINGDSAAVTVDIVSAADGTTPYPLQGWVFTLSVKRSRHQTDVAPLIEKTVVTDGGSQVIFQFLPSDTQNMLQGAYDYDIQVTNPEGDAVFTPFMGKLRIKAGVTGLGGGL